jgi:hypothetical protein
MSVFNKLTALWRSMAFSVHSTHFSKPLLIHSTTQQRIFDGTQIRIVLCCVCPYVAMKGGLIRCESSKQRRSPEEDGLNNGRGVLEVCQLTVEHST